MAVCRCLGWARSSNGLTLEQASGLIRELVSPDVAPGSSTKIGTSSSSFSFGRRAVEKPGLYSISKAGDALNSNAQASEASACLPWLT